MMNHSVIHERRIAEPPSSDTPIHGFEDKINRTVDPNHEPENREAPRAIGQSPSPNRLRAYRRETHYPDMVWSTTR